MEGETKAVPYRRSTETACDYCKYRHVCGFDLRVPGYRYRDIGKMSREEALAAMKSSAESSAQEKQKKDAGDSVSEANGREEA